MKWGLRIFWVLIAIFDSIFLIPMVLALLGYPWCVEKLFDAAFSVIAK